ncbi:adenylosuccinate synthetase [Colletotrichum higginsianum]|uniref:Adenylosuccinate synthetase n=1 Tax=Colletotrichum higginsianum (strain IMI 349063) TaxID=759273 RepID=H1V0L2_COLHI|nr:adenylosuccinate synthetase [Colletotrichum higginsianum]
MLSLSASLSYLFPTPIHPNSPSQQGGGHVRENSEGVYIDEGKGKLVDVLGQDAQICARAQVGNAVPCG